MAAGVIGGLGYSIQLLYKGYTVLTLLSADCLLADNKELRNVGHC